MAGFMKKNKKILEKHPKLDKYTTDKVIILLDNLSVLYCGQGAVSQLVRVM